MAVFQIPFRRPPRHITASRGRVTTHRLAAAEPPDRDPARDALESLARIEQALEGLETSVDHQMASVREQIVTIAAGLAKQALNSDHELVEARVQHFAEVLFRQMQASDPLVAYVHPECVSVLRQWAEDGQRQHIQVQPDENLEAGDCRLEADGKGVLASLDAFLEAAARRVRPGRGGLVE
jgi:flagellar biosynthesis/type III secretory pathway protein FliH